MNLQYIKDKHADQPAKDMPHLTASTCCLLNLRGCKQLTVKDVCICKVFCVMLYSALCNYSVDFVVLTKALCTLMCTLYIYIYSICIIGQRQEVTNDSSQIKKGT
jgi:hypothetical protein